MNINKFIIFILQIGTILMKKWIYHILKIKAKLILPQILPQKEFIAINLIAKIY